MALPKARNEVKFILRSKYKTKHLGKNDHSWSNTKEIYIIPMCTILSNTPRPCVLHEGWECKGKENKKGIRSRKARWEGLIIFPLVQVGRENGGNSIIFLIFFFSFIEGLNKNRKQTGMVKKWRKHSNNGMEEKFC